MFYEIHYDMDKIDERALIGKQYIYAEKNNFSELDLKYSFKGGFRYSIVQPSLDIIWPNVKFYYSSKVSSLESDYLLNTSRWPLVHKRVKETFEKEGIKGVRFYPIVLVDVVTNVENINYFVMYIENFLEAYDMDKSKFRYLEKYNAYVFIPKCTFLSRHICDKHDIFRCSQNVSCIYISEKLYEIIVRKKFSGFKFNAIPEC